MKIGLLTVAISAGLLGGCQAIQNSPIGKVMDKVPGVAEVAQQKVTEEMLKDISDPLVRKNFAATYNKGQVRTTATLGVGQEIYKTVTEMDMSGGKYHYKTAEERKGKIQGEMIFMGDTTYAKDYADNTWWKQTTKPEAVTSGELDQFDMPGEFDLEEESAKSAQSTYRKVGEELCGTMAPGLTCYAYEEIYPDNGGVRKFWFDTKEYLTRKEEQGVGEGKMVSEMTYDKISVTAPTPTKDVPEGESIFMMLGKQQYEQNMQEAQGAEGVDYQKFLDQIKSTGGEYGEEASF